MPDHSPSAQQPGVWLPPAIAELIAERENGFLCRPGEPHTLAGRILTAAESPRLHTCIEAARGHAYDAFRAQQCV